MDVSARTVRVDGDSAGPRRGFTLVELLVVITIIGILASLITAAAIRVRAAANRAMVKQEIVQIQMAALACKEKFGDTPPDFTDADAVRRYLRQAFPRYNCNRGGAGGDPWAQLVFDLNHYTPGNDPNTAAVILDPTTLDPASAIPFFLGGLPETFPTAGQASWKPAGFHADPEQPFQPGLPRTEALYAFTLDRLTTPTAANSLAPLRFFPPRGITQPYVYFKTRRVMAAAGQNEFGYVDASGTPATFAPLSWPIYNSANAAGDYAVPYLDQPLILAAALAPAPPRVWRNQDTFQILCAGFDNQSGAGANLRFSRLGKEVVRGSNTDVPMNDANFDNITNFSDVTIEDEMLK